MLSINRVHEGNKSELVTLLQRNGKLAEFQRNGLRATLYYLLEDKQSTLGYAQWIQDPEKEAWIFLKHIELTTGEQMDPLFAKEQLLFCSEAGFRLFYETIFDQAQILGARFFASLSTNPMKQMYRRLGYHLLDDEPQELWQKEFPRKQV